MATRCRGGWGGGGSEVWLHARVLWGCEARCEIWADHGAGSDEHEDKQSRRCHAPIIGFAAAFRRRESPPNGLQHGAGGGQHADKQIRRCRALIVGFGSRRQAILSGNGVAVSRSYHGYRFWPGVCWRFDTLHWTAPFFGHHGVTRGRKKVLRWSGCGRICVW